MSQNTPDPALSRQQGAPAQSTALPSNAVKPSTKLPAQPAQDDFEKWKAHWKAHRQPWRTEPEIDAARQQELATRYTVTPDIKQGIYPFRGMKLSRADVEWLLATYRDSFTSEIGLDVRGVDLNGVDLSNLPLNGLHGGLTILERGNTSEEEGKTAAVLMNNSCLDRAQLQNAHLYWAQLQGAKLFFAQFQYADLSNAQLQGAALYEAQLQGATLCGSQLQNANLSGAQLQGAVLIEAQLQGAYLSKAQLQGADLSEAQLQHAYLSKVQFQGADLSEAQLQDTNLSEAQFQGANLSYVLLANSQGIGPQLVDIRWDGTNLATIDWSEVEKLGEEYVAQQKKQKNGDVKQNVWDHLYEYRTAVRANRQLAVALQTQGLNEEAAHFAYLANMLRRKVLWFQMIQPKISFWQRLQKLGAWCFSYLLNFLAGYGYKPGRSFLAYLLIILGFMGLYLLTSQFVSPHLSWDEALVLSLSSFHGRGFFTQTLTLGDPYARLAVAEAVLGLFVEVSFIATFTQRFFGK